MTCLDTPPNIGGGGSTTTSLHSTFGLWKSCGPTGYFFSAWSVQSAGIFGHSKHKKNQKLKNACLQQFGNFLEQNQPQKNCQGPFPLKRAVPEEFSRGLNGVYQQNPDKAPNLFFFTVQNPSPSYHPLGGKGSNHVFLALLSTKFSEVMEPKKPGPPSRCVPPLRNNFIKKIFFCEPLAENFF